MSEQLEKVRKAENRARSQLVREALREYIENRYPAYTPTRAEAAIQRGRASIKQGEYISLNQLHHELESARQARQEKIS